MLEAIVEFDRFCHSKEEPHLLNSYGEGISTDGEALLLGCFETKKYFAIETRLILVIKFITSKDFCNITLKTKPQATVGMLLLFSSCSSRVLARPSKIITC